ncbi:hypothetical protein BGZ83_006995 [Gryganskiella cystojenkinii]|nr:hypothetical protein BGZ83_006995 [Gryganskiella cystojenkinii]
MSNWSFRRSSKGKKDSGSSAQGLDGVANRPAKANYNSFAIYVFEIFKANNLGDKERTSSSSSRSLPDGSTSASSARSSKVMRGNHSLSANNIIGSLSPVDEPSSPILSNLPGPPPVPPKSDNDFLNKLRKSSPSALTGDPRLSLDSNPGVSSGSATIPTLSSLHLAFPPLPPLPPLPPPPPSTPVNTSSSLPRLAVESYKLGSVNVRQTPSLASQRSKRSEVFQASAGAGSESSNGQSLSDSPVLIQTPGSKPTTPTDGTGKTTVPVASSFSSSALAHHAAFDRTASAVAAVLQSYTPPSSMYSSQTMTLESDSSSEFSRSASIHPETVIVQSVVTSPLGLKLTTNGRENPRRGKLQTNQYKHIKKNGGSAAYISTSSAGGEDDNPSQKVALDHSYLTDAFTLLGRIFNNPLYSDLELYVDGTTFHVHRGILAEHCGHFQNLFEKARRQEPVAPVRGLDCSFAPDRQRPIPHIDPVNDGSRETPRGGGRDRVSADTDRATTTNGTTESCGDVAKFLNNITGDVTPIFSSTEDALVPSTNATVSHSAAVSTLTSSKPSTRALDTNSGTDAPSFSSIFVAGERQHGYTAHDFGVFLQLLYWILTPESVQESDLLPVFRICSLYNVPGLVSVLSQRIFKSLKICETTWPSVLRFSERYRLRAIKQQTLEYASRHGEIWSLAVEMLDLEDFKIVLRGIRKEDVVPAAARTETATAAVTTTREIKDELLMMYLLVHYQNGSSIPDSLSRKDPSPVSSLNVEGIARRLSIICPSTRIQRQLHQQQPHQGSTSMRAMTSQGAEDASQTVLTKSNIDIGHHDKVSQSSSSAIGLPIRTEKAEKARSWMKQFKRECGWDGDVSQQ